MRFKWVTLIHNSTSTYGSPLMLLNGIENVGNFPVPSEGTYCFSIGNRKPGGNAQAMKYTFTVTNDNKYFKIRYALVFEDPVHSGGENPSGQFYFINGNESAVAVSFASIPIYISTNKYFIADLSNPFFSFDWKCSLQTLGMSRV